MIIDSIIIDVGADPLYRSQVIMLAAIGMARALHVENPEEVGNLSGLIGLRITAGEDGPVMHRGVVIGWRVGFAGIRMRRKGEAA